ncbi:MAG: hybrid sensor histidine kinase/response regulator [Deferrisomatales bacterium]
MVRKPVSPVSRRLFEILRDVREDLGRQFVEILRENVGPHYKARTTEELEATTEGAVASYLAVLGSGDWGPMAAFVQEIAQKRFPLQFPLSEVQRAFAVFREITHPLVAGAFEGEELVEALQIVDRTVDEAINRFSDTYQDLHLKEIRRTSTELAEAHRRLRSQYEEVAEAAMFKSQFFANMSHELRSPLNSIIGYTELLLDGVDGTVSGEQEKDLQRILAASRYLLKLINNILDMTRIEAGRMEVEAQPFDVAALVAEAMDTVNPLAYRKQLELSTELAAGVGAFVSDREKVKQILINLLANAVKFTDEGKVVCSVRQEPGRLSVEVADTGIGISPEDRRRIFSKFFQADPSHAREYRGTGLGLPLCHMLIELLGGELGVESEPGSGSRFRLWIPELPMDGARPAEISGARPRVLVIEDDPSALELIEKVLEAGGMTSVLTPRGEEGLRLARETRPAAITLDLLLPGMDGWKVLRELKADPATRNIPVAIVSCLDSRERGLRAGADAFLVKPLDRKELVRTLHRLVADPVASEDAREAP